MATQQKLFTRLNLLLISFFLFSAAAACTVIYLNLLDLTVPVESLQQKSTSAAKDGSKSESVVLTSVTKEYVTNYRLI